MLNERWAALWHLLGADTEPAKVFAEISARYSEPHRAYHTLDHIAHCLREFDEVKAVVRHPFEVELALWFHDIVYDTRAKDSEEQSAALAQRVMYEAGFPVHFGRRVAALILESKHAASPSANIDAQTFVDIDLAILGQPELAFDAYELQIRQEYSWVPEDLFRGGRAAIIRAFLERPALYTTEYFRAKYERQARENLSLSVRALTAE